MTEQPHVGGTTPKPSMGLRVIVTGTDPASPRGGIGFAMKGYLAAIRRGGFEVEFVPTYSREGVAGKLVPFLLAMWRVPRNIRRAQRSGKKAVVYAHAGAGVSLVREGFVLGLARLLGASTALQLHAPEVDVYLKWSIARWLLSVICAPAQVLCVLTPYWREQLKSAGFHQDIAVIPNPLPLEYEELASQAHRPRSGDSSIRIACITRLVRRKGADLLIGAMAHLPSRFSLTVAGDGPEMERCRRLIREHGLEGRVQLLGWLGEGAKRDTLASSDVFCLPTRGDSFGMAIVEAMCAGLPVVALRWGAIPSVVREEETALLVENPDPEEVAKALARLADQELRHRLGAAGSRLALQRYSIEVVAGHLQGLLQSLASIHR